MGCQDGGRGSQIGARSEVSYGRPDESQGHFSVMPKFAANLTTMFTELAFPQRFQAARDVGFIAVECQYPYAHSVAEVSQWLESTGLEFVLLNTPPGDEDAGESGLAALPGRESDFRQLFELALEYATGLGARMIHVLAGVVPDGTPVETCETTFVANVRWAADLANQGGVKVLLEPLNTQDVPGYLHSRSRHTRRLIETIDRNNVRMQFDFYHLQIMEGNLGKALRTHLDVIGHIQFSSVPGRYEPQYGEVNIAFLFDLLDELGYDGWVGAEYGAKTTTPAGMSWGAAYGLG